MLLCKLLNHCLPAAAISCLSGVISNAFTCYICIKEYILTGIKYIYSSFYILLNQVNLCTMKIWQGKNVILPLNGWLQIKLSLYSVITWLWKPIWNHSCYLFCLLHTSLLQKSDNSHHHNSICVLWIANTFTSFSIWCGFCYDTIST